MDLSLTQGLERALQVNPDALAVVFGERRRSWRELHGRVAALATGLRALGVEPGDRIAVMAHNSDRYIELYLATWWIGAVVVPLNTRWSSVEVLYALQDCEARLLCFDDGFAALAEEALSTASTASPASSSDAASSAGTDSSIALLYMGDGDPPHAAASQEALAASSRPSANARPAGADLAGIFYTGGTTGRPKGVMLSHGALFGNVLISQADAPFDERAVLLHYAPMFHLAGLSFLLRGTLRAARHVVLAGFTPAAVLATIASEKITHTFAVPTMLQMLVDSPAIDQHDLGSLRSLSYGSSPISEALLDRLFVHLPHVEIFQGYGMTELTAAVTFLSSRHHTPEGRRQGKLKSAGQAKTGIDVRIEDDDGNEVPRGRVGEIVVRSPCVMNGYWRQPEATAQALRGGWMHTGDAAYMDAEGFVFIVDRLKDMIVTGGENVYSAEVERALSLHAAVAAAAVIGIPDARWGEAVHAVVVLRPGATADAPGLIAHCREHIAGFKCPRSIELRGSLPLSAAGKVLKQELRAPWWGSRQRGIA